MRLELLNALDGKAIAFELGSKKLKVADALATVKIPKKKSEKYRYFDIESLVSKDWDVVTTPNESFEKKGNTLLIEDSKVVSVPDSSNISVELKEFEDVDLEHFDGLYFASHLLAKNTIVVRVSSDEKFEIKHKFTQEDKLINYRVVLLVDANTHVQVYESFDGEAKGSFILAGYDIFLSRDGSLEFIKNQTLQESSYTPIFTSAQKVDSNASFNLKTYDFANSNGLQLFQTTLLENASMDAIHLLYTNKEAKAGTVSEIVHSGKNSKSKQNAKNILNDKSRGIFDALIKVTNKAKGTIAHQNSKSILLNSGAYMASKPQLEIYIDDLEASHGSTTGQLDEKALFYLRSRGIKEVEAKKMLILAFANEAIDTIKDETIANHIYVDFEKAYYGSAELDCIKTCHECEDMVLGE